MSHRRISTWLIGSVAAVILSANGDPGRWHAAPPRLVVWAWEQATDLTGLTRPDVGVAYLAEEIRLRSDGIVTRPRQQPLKVSAGTWLTAVVRIDIDPAATPSMSPIQRARVAGEILAVASREAARITSVQIDFDAPRSARSFYAALLRDLRRDLSPRLRLSMTALASWCLGDRWIAGLPVDEAVPMLFRMGTGEREVRAWLDAGKDFGPAVCRSSVGLATDEPAPEVRADRRIYVFSPRPLGALDVDALAAEWNR